MLIVNINLLIYYSIHIILPMILLETQIIIKYT